MFEPYEVRVDTCFTARDEVTFNGNDAHVKIYKNNFTHKPYHKIKIVRCPV